MSGRVTVGIDVGTTSVKALAVDDAGEVVARARVPHHVYAPQVDQLEHDAKKAWRQGPRRAFAAVTAEIDATVAGVGVTSMVPSFTAVDRRGIPRLPGLLYGDVRGRLPAARPGAGRSPLEVPDPTARPADQATALLNQSTVQLMPEAEGFLHWAVAGAPGAAGYWPCQAVATHALSGIAAVDGAVAASLGSLFRRGQWDPDVLDRAGASPEQMPLVAQMGAPAGTLPGTDTIITGGTVDAFCDQIVAGADRPGDVLAIFGATLIVWVVTDTWVEVPGLGTLPHTTPDRIMIGGPSNAGALFVDWARALLGGRATSRRRPVETPERPGDPERVPVWLPYLRGERTPFHDPALRASVHGLDITQGPDALERSAYEASGFVIRRLLERSGVEGRRVVASGGGTNSAAWMAAVADTTGLPVETVAVSEGAALGAAYMARMGAGLESGLDGAGRWARTGRRVEPDPQWSKAATRRYEIFEELGPGTLPGGLGS
ncbi:MAG TPA: FGGY-family carbohydrate kinase [Acidimicrobiales bacterium]|nr:FGGY-family carbohydrate kinase [Acidimicrobiales bacterium]